MSHLPASLGDALALARGRIATVDARILLREASGATAAQLIAFQERPLAPEAAGLFLQWLERREAGEPVAHILGQREFYGLNLHITADVLDPRPDTETLVDWALSVLQTAASQWPIPTVLDMGTGSGAIALAIAKNHGSAKVTATDFSPTALAIAKHNAQVQQLPIEFKISDWWSHLKGQKWDVIVSNPPYIALGDPHLPALRHEPAMALISGSDGLDAIRKIIGDAPSHLNPQGWLLIEHGYDQANAVSQLLESAGFKCIEHRYDLAGNCRCSGGQWLHIEGLAFSQST